VLGLIAREGKREKRYVSRRARATARQQVGRGKGIFNHKLRGDRREACADKRERGTRVGAFREASGLKSPPEGAESLLLYDLGERR